jgi:hypothetical protein
MWTDAARAAATPSPAPGGLWELPEQRGLISPGLYVAAALFLFAWVGFAAVAVGRRHLTP